MVGIMVNIEKLNFKYKNKVIFENFDLNIKPKTITTIIGPNGSGKTTLVKLLLGLLKFEGNIKVDKVELNKENIKDIRKKIGVISEDLSREFVKDRVYDEIKFNSTIEENEIKEVTKLLNIENILDWEIKKLNNNQKSLICLAKILLQKKEILIFDQTLFLMPQKDSIIKKLKRKGMTIINISHDIEDTLISDEIIILDKGKIIIKGKKEKIYENEKILNSLGYNLPFMVELSNRLIFYGLIDHIIYDMEEMVERLWQ